MSSVPSLFRDAARQADLVVVVPRASDLRTDDRGRENQQQQRPSSQQSSQRQESQERPQGSQSQSQEEAPALTPLLRYHSDSQLSEGQAIGEMYRNTTFSRIHSVATVVGAGDDAMRVAGVSGSTINGGSGPMPPSPPSPQQTARQQPEEATSPFKSEVQEQPTMRPYELLATAPNHPDADDASVSKARMARFLSDANTNSGSSAASRAGSSDDSEEGGAFAVHVARMKAAGEEEDDDDEDSSEYSFDDDDDDDDEDEDERADWTADTTMDLDSVGAWRTDVGAGDASRDAGKMGQQQANRGHASNRGDKLRASASNGATDSAQGQGGRSGIRIEPDGKVVKTRRRTRPREAQILMQFFEKEQFPSAEQRDELAKKTGLAPRAVTVWFQNRRQTQKRRATERAAAGAARQGTSADVHEKQQQEQQQLTPEPVAERRAPLDTPSHFRTTLMKMGANFDASPPRNAASEPVQVGTDLPPAAEEDLEAISDAAAAPGAIKDLRSLLDETQRFGTGSKPALVTSFDCASIDDVMASQACGRSTVAHMSFATTDAAAVEKTGSAPPANNKLVDLLARIRQRSTVANVAPRGEQRGIDALNDAVSTRTLPEKQSITHASIDEYIHHQRSSSSSAGAPSSPILGLSSQGAKPVNAAIKDLLSLRGGSANQRIKSHSPPAAAPAALAARSNSEPAQSEESANCRSDQSRIRLLLLGAHHETARKVKRNATLLQLMQSSSNGSSDEEEALINDLELPSDEETSLRIIACRRAEKEVVKRVGDRRQQKAVFSAREAIKQQKKVRKVKGGAGPLARSKHVLMHSESRRMFRARRKANLDRVAGRDRASTASSSEEETDSSGALANRRRKSSTKSTLGSRLSGLQRNRTRSAPLVLDKKRSHEDAHGPDAASALHDKRRSALSRSTTGPLHIASLQRGDQRSNTREAPSSPVSSDAEELALFSSGKQLPGSTLFRPPTFMLNAGKARSGGGTNSSSSSAATAHMPRRTSSLAPYNSSYNSAGAHQSSGGFHAQQNRAVRVHVNRAGDGQQRNGSHLKRSSYGLYQQTSRMPLGNGSAGNQQLDAGSNPLSGGSRSQHSNSSSPARSNRSASVSDDEDKENSSPRQVDDSGFFTSTVKAMPAALSGGSAALREFAARDSGDVSSSSSPFLTSPTKGRSRNGAEHNDAQKRLGLLAERDRAAAEVLLGLGFSQ